MPGGSSDKLSNKTPAAADGRREERRRLYEDYTAPQILVKCHAGCSVEVITGALGLTVKDLFPRGQAQGKPEIVTTYDYRDAADQLLYQVVRYFPKDFRQRRPDGKGGWIWNMQGIQPVPYRLPELLEAFKRGIAFVVEGEKDADNLARIGLTATCNHGGAGKWREAHAKHFPAGAEVAVLPDNDDPGRKHAQEVAHSLAARGCRVKVLELPGLPPKGDVSDWLAAGGTKEQLLQLCEQVPPWKPVMAQQKPVITPKIPSGFSATELVKKEFPDPVWVVPDLLPEGLAILAGRPKLGKSLLALGIAIAVAGGGMALGSIVVPKANAVYLALEDGQRRLKSRLQAMLSGAEAPDNLFFYNDFLRLDQGGLQALELTILKHNARLVIVDTLARLRPPGKKGGNAYLEDYGVFAALKGIADRCKAALLVIHHQNKAGYMDVLDSVSGTTGITGAADTIFIFKRSRGKADAELFATSRDFEEKELALEN